MVIRPWRETDRGPLAKMVKSAPDSDTGDALLAALHIPSEISAFDAHTTLVAADRDDLIGIGTLWENDIHPARWRVALHGCPTFWPQDVAASMLAGLRELRPDQRPMQTAASAHDESRSAFFQEHGFSLLMRTRSGVLPPGAIPESVAVDFANAGRWTAKEGVRVVSLAGSRLRQIPYVQFAHLHAAIYEQGHAWDPVRELTDREAAEMFLDTDEFMPEATYVALERKRLIGVSSLRRTDRPGLVELGWTGAVLDDPQ